MTVRPFCIALFGVALAAATPAAALEARDLMGSWYASGLTATTAEQDPTILEIFFTVNIDGTIDIYDEETDENDQSYVVSYDRCFHPRTQTSDAVESDEDDEADAEIVLQTLITGGEISVTSDGVVTGELRLDPAAQETLGYKTISIDDFRMNTSAELITGVTNLTDERVMHVNMVRLPVDEDDVNVPCLFADCDVDPAPTATLTSLAVVVGDLVAKDQVLAIVTPDDGGAAKEIKTPVDGTISQVNTQVGATVEFEQTLMVIESPATTVSELENTFRKGQFVEGSWKIVGYFEQIEDRGRDYPYLVPDSLPTWEIVSLNVEIGSAVVQGETVARLEPVGGGTILDVPAPNDGIVTEIYQSTSEIVLPDLGGSEEIVAPVPGVGGFPQKILCLGPEPFKVFGITVCGSQLQRGDFVREGDILATTQLTCCPNSTQIPVLAPRDGFITEINVSPCFNVGALPPSECTDAIVQGDPIMTTAPEATLVDLAVITNDEISIGQVIAKAEDQASGSSPVDILSTANGRVTEIFFDQWTENIEYGTPLMTVKNFQPAGEEVAAGETLFVVNEDPTCHPDFASQYSIKAGSMAPCAEAEITAISVSDGEQVCAGDTNFITYEYTCPDPANTSGPPIQESRSDFSINTDSIIESVHVSVGQMVRPGDTLITLSEGSTTPSGSINGNIGVFPNNVGGGAQGDGLVNPHTGQLQTSIVEYTDSCDLILARTSTNSSLRVQNNIVGQPAGEFFFSQDPGGDWSFQISRDRNFAIGNSVGFYLGGNFRHQNMLMVKGPQQAIHVPSLGLGDPDADLTSLHGLYATDNSGGPYLNPPYNDPDCQTSPPPTACAGSTVSVGDPIATLAYTTLSGDPKVETILSPIDGYVDTIYIEEGTTDIAYDQTIMTLRSSPAYPTPSNQKAETTWEIRGFTDEAALLAGATRSGTLSVNEDGDQLTGGSFQSSDGDPPLTVTGGAVELVIPISTFSDPIDTWVPEKTTGVTLFGTPGAPMNFAGSVVTEQENLMLSFQRDVIAGVTEDTDGVTGFMVGMVSVGMVPEPSARLLALAALGALGAMRWRLRRRR